MHTAPAEQSESVVHSSVHALVLEHFPGAHDAVGPAAHAPAPLQVPGAVY
jgi:hypothetical protein